MQRGRQAIIAWTFILTFKEGEGKILRGTTVRQRTACHKRGTWCRRVLSPRSAIGLPPNGFMTSYVEKSSCCSKGFGLFWPPVRIDWWFVRRACPNSRLAYFALCTDHPRPTDKACHLAWTVLQLHQSRALRKNTAQNTWACLVPTIINSILQLCVDMIASICLLDAIA